MGLFELHGSLPDSPLHIPMIKSLGPRAAPAHNDNPSALSRLARSLKCRTRLAGRKPGWVASGMTFGLVGLSGMVLDIVLFLTLSGWMALGASRAVAIGGAMSWNYVLNRYVTFCDSQQFSFGKQYVLFCASCSFGALLNWGISVSLCLANDWFLAHRGTALSIGVGAGFTLNFVLSRSFVFRS